MSHLLNLVVFKLVSNTELPLILSRDNPNEEQSARGPRPQPLTDTADTAKGNAIPHSTDASSDSNGSGGSESRVNHHRSGSGHDEDAAYDDGFVYQDPDADEADDAPQAAAGNHNTRYSFH